MSPTSPQAASPATPSDEHWVQAELGFPGREPSPAPERVVSPRSRRLDKATRRRNLSWVRQVRADLAQRHDAA